MKKRYWNYCCRSGGDDGDDGGDDRFGYVLRIIIV